MAKKENEIISEIKILIERLREKHDIHEAYLFGSCVAGKCRRHSDVDIAVVLSKLRKHNGAPFDETFDIFHEGQEFDSRFEIVCFSKEEFREDRFSIVKHIKREGKRIL